MWQYAVCWVVTVLSVTQDTWEWLSILGLFLLLFYTSLSSVTWLVMSCLRGDGCVEGIQYFLEDFNIFHQEIFSSSSVLYSALVFFTGSYSLTQPPTPLPRRTSFITVESHIASLPWFYLHLWNTWGQPIVHIRNDLIPRIRMNDLPALQIMVKFQSFSHPWFPFI